MDPQLKRCIQVLEFSKWPLLLWKPWTYVKIFDLTKGFPQDLAYILSRVGRIFWPIKIASEWPPFPKWPPTKLAKFQCSLISMTIYMEGYFEVRNWLVMMTIAFNVIFIFKMALTKLAKFQCSLISMKIDIKGYFEVRNWLVVMKIAFRVIFTIPPFPKWPPKKSINC